MQPRFLVIKSESAGSAVYAILIRICSIVSVRRVNGFSSSIFCRANQFSYIEKVRQEVRRSARDAQSVSTEHDRADAARVEHKGEKTS